MITAEYVEHLAALHSVPLGYDDLEGALEEICRIALRAVPTAAGASLTTYRSGQPRAAASDDWARALDESQYEEHEGPCLDAVRSGNAFRIRDFQDEPRWPFYGPRAREN